jgi:Phage integrase family.
MKQRREPLEPEELRALVHAGENMDLKHDFTIKILAFTGLRAAELAHATEDWIIWQEDLIRVPAYQSCDCSYCRSQAKKMMSALMNIGIRNLMLARERYRFGILQHYE